MEFQPLEKPEKNLQIDGITSDCFIQSFYS